jgi:hypothetical protein
MIVKHPNLVSVQFLRILMPIERRKKTRVQKSHATVPLTS